MGLDAVVYKKEDHVDAQLREKYKLKLDKKTGELYLNDEDAMSLDVPVCEFEAIEKRLGNAILIADAKKIISKYTTPDSILMSNILFSGSHCGTVISCQKNDDLLMNVEHVINKVKVREDVESLGYIIKLLNDIVDLINVSKVEGNPIVFV